MDRPSWRWSVVCQTRALLVSPVSSPVMGLWGIVVAGGSGTRYGRLKQLEPLGGQRVLDLAVSALRRGAGSELDGIVVVVPAAVVDTPPTDAPLPGDIVAAGGDSRAASVRAGLGALPSDADRVLVHDGARPLVSAAAVHRVVAGLDAAAAVVPVVPVTDSLRTIDGEPVDRSAFVAVQTPQGFHRAVLEKAHEASGDPASATDDASLVDAIGGTVIHVDGDVSNLKITTPADLVVAEALLAERLADPPGESMEGES